jgi:hypothetical protein
MAGAQASHESERRNLRQNRPQCLPYTDQHQIVGLSVFVKIKLSHPQKKVPIELEYCVLATANPDAGCRILL